MRYEVVSPEVEERLAKLSESEFQTYLFLEPHPDLPSQWLVNSDDPTFQARLGDVVRSYRAVAPFAYDEFEQRAYAEGYRVVFLHDPEPTFDWLRSLSNEPEAEVFSTLEGTVNGLFPFQVQAFNFAKTLNGVVLNHSTGTGKTVTASALTAYHADYHKFNLCLWVVKAHNRVNTARALMRNVGFTGLVIDGSQANRTRQYASAMYWLRRQKSERLSGPVLILNYEKFREDKEYLKHLVEKNSVLIIWDEMPTKLRNRHTKLYKAVCEVLYTSQSNRTFYPRRGSERPAELRQIMLSATPIENSPMDWFNCVRLLDPTIYGSVKDFTDTYVSSWDLWDNPKRWRKLDFMGAKAAHITHQVDKNDPDIAQQFPQMLTETVDLEMDAADRKLYDKLVDEYKKRRKKNDSMLDPQELLAAIGTLQAICNNPRAVVASAERREDYMEAIEAGNEDAKKQGSEVSRKLVALVGDAAKFTDAGKGDEPRNAKLLRLRDDLASGEKTVLFTAYNANTIPYITEWLDKWGVRYVTYHGSMSMKQRQQAEDAFKADPEVQVFVSSDSGSDSINLEVASLCIHYDRPWKWTTVEQRQHRIHRITSTFKKVRVLTYSIVNSVEDRRQVIIQTKYGYHSDVMKGTISEQSAILRTNEMWQIITGEEPA